MPIYPDKFYVIEFQMPTGQAYRVGPYPSEMAESVINGVYKALEAARSGGHPAIYHLVDEDNKLDQTFFLNHFCAIQIMEAVPKADKPTLLQGDEAMDELRKHALKTEKFH